MKLVTKFAVSLAALGLSFNVLAAELNVYASMPEKYASPVSYTHLTLPTKRIV